MHFFRQVVGVPVVSKEVLSQRTADYQTWVEAFARNHRLPIEWAIFGTRLNRTMRGKLATVIDRIEHGHHVFRAYFKHAFLKQ